jgi:hypothetical protein
MTQYRYEQEVAGGTFHTKRGDAFKLQRKHSEGD